MAGEVLELNPTRLVIAALVGLVILLVLIIKFKIQAMVSILIGAISIGLLARRRARRRSLYKPNRN